MFNRSCGVVLLVALVTAATAVDARAQYALDISTPLGTLGGLVVDETEAVVPDVVIGAMNTATGVRRQTISIGDGTFAIPLLPAGSYVVTAERAGFAPLEVRNVSLSRDQYLMLRIRLRVGAVQDSVQVTADGGSDDVSQILLPAAARGASGIRVSGQLQQQLPLSPGSPDYSQALFLASGVISRDQLGRYLVHGADGHDTVVLVDGIDLTSNRQPAMLPLRMGPEAISHIEVRTAGMDASTPLTQGALLKVTTRSGANEARAEAGVLFRARGWIGNNEPGGSSARGGMLRPDGAVGIPLEKDRAWVFGAYARDESRSTASRTATDIAMLKAFAPDWTPYDVSANGDERYAKVTTRPSPAQEITGFYQANTQSSTGPGGPTEGAFLRYTIGGTAVGATWNAVWSDSFLSRFSASFNNKTFNQTSDFQDRTALVVQGGVYQSAAALTGAGAVAYLNAMPGCCFDQPASKLSIGGDATWYRAHPLGTHEVQFGFLLQPRLHIAEIQRFNNRGHDYDEAVLRNPRNPAAGYQMFHEVIYDAPQMTVQDSHGSDDAIFIQDGWRPANRLTITVGLRADHITDSDVLTGEPVRNAWAIGPRSSATWEVRPGSVLRISWGRIHESAPAGRYVPDAIGLTGRHDLYDVNLDGIFETDHYVPTLPPIPPKGVDVERRQAYVNELSGGYRVRLPARIALDAGLVRRDFHALPLLDSGAVYENGMFTGYRTWTAPQRVIADVWTVPVVTDLTVQATRLTARTQLVASYTRTFRHVAGTWVPSDPASILQPSAFADDKGIGSTSAGTANTMMPTADANLAIDHSLTATFVCQLPRRLNAAVHYELQSGPWSGPIITLLPAPDPKYPPWVPLTDPRFGLILNVANPLATPRRFAYPTRGEGQFRLPALQVLNFRVGKRLELGSGRMDVALDVFNPFNWGRFLTFKTDANYTVSPAFGQGGTRQRPRTVQASVRFFF